MKKILSVALVLIMMMAVCVPAFANKTISDKTPEKTGDTLVQTSKIKEDGTSGESYSVIIPAKAEIPWGKTPYDLNYKVESHLAYGKKLSVSVRSSGNNKMTLSDDANEKLAYTLGGTTNFLADGPVVYNNEETPAVTQPLQIKVTSDAWARAIVGVYSDTLIFTADVKEA